MYTHRDTHSKIKYKLKGLKRDPSRCLKKKKAMNSDESSGKRKYQRDVPSLPQEPSVSHDWIDEIMDLDRSVQKLTFINTLLFAG